MKEERGNTIRLSVLESARQLHEAAAAGKCWPCGCLHDSIAAIRRTFPERERPKEISAALSAAQERLVAVKYDCLGCEVCYPALAINALGQAGCSVELDPCATGPVEARNGWPALPGNYHVLRYRAPVAVCTLNSEALADALAAEAPEGLGIVGTLHTENLGIERVIQNVLGNPHIRFLVLCGQDTQQAIGHLPGQSLHGLFTGGLDERGRIRGAHGKRPVLKNVNSEQVGAFREQLEPVVLIGEEQKGRILTAVEACASRAPGPFAGAPPGSRMTAVHAEEPERLVPDPAGFFVIYPDSGRHRLVVEHYRKDAVLDCVLEGKTPAALVAEIVNRGLLSRLDHAAYLGRELTRAERSLETGEPYVQDRAPGTVGGEPGASNSGCSSSCSG